MQIAEKNKKKLLEAFEDKSAKVGIFGLGYVGLPLAICKAACGFNIIGIDRLENRVNMINKAKSYLVDVKNDVLQEYVLEKKKIVATSDHTVINDLDVVIVCVPTPLTVNKSPDLSYIRNVSEQIAENLNPGQLISLESTTYPGTTKEIMKPILEQSGLKAGQDFFLTFSPERINPGNKRFDTRNTNKIIGGITKNCLEVGKAFYEKGIDDIICVNSTTTAEMTKVFENTFRSVNIALVNELALLCDKMNLNVWDVINAASTKPFGFMRFDPGPGVGGQCIPIDPFYLTWKAKEYNFHTRFIELAGEINDFMPIHVKNKVAQALNTFKKPVNGSIILVLGVTYKKNIEDTRQSPAEIVINELMKDGAIVVYNDPYVDTYTLTSGKTLKSTCLNEIDFEKVDCTIVITDHSCYDYDMIVERSKIVVDSRNGTKNVKKNRDKIVLL